jgi:hypothetical protein
MISVNHKSFKLIKEYNDFSYQKKLTEKLDKVDNDFNQGLINEIVLWKVNRYAELNLETLDKLNCIKKSDKELDKKLTRAILSDLLKTKGIQLPMASTILRFKNPKFYQILDQRVYRILYGENLNLSYNKKSDEQIEIYLNYLERLRIVKRTEH